jgi:ABC-type Mn2+/Zn2+ transport system ATPase subunit
MLEKVVPIEVPPERKRVRFSFPAAPKSGRTVIELKGVRKAYGSTRVFDGIDLLIERGDRVALIGPNGAGKSTLMRMLSGTESPDSGTCTLGHQVVMQYFAQDEATRLDPTRTVYETLEAGSPVQMVPAIRTILGGFLFGGDDIYKKAGVLSGGERTRLAVARMLLRPANTLLLDEPTNHLDMDSKDVLLDALEDFGGTLILVSHDRYFIESWRRGSSTSAAGAWWPTPAATRSTAGAWRNARRRRQPPEPRRSRRNGRSRRRRRRERWRTRRCLHRRTRGSGLPHRSRALPRSRPRRRRRATRARTGSGRRPRTAGGSVPGTRWRAASPPSRRRSPSGRRR